MSKILTEKDFNDAAELLNVEVAAIKAVAEIESRGSGFQSDGQPVILFESYQFGRLTKFKYNKQFPNLSTSSWIRNYGASSMQHTRLQQAVNIGSYEALNKNNELVKVQPNRDAALQSASWGKFQIMGFNYKSAGFKDLQSFINAMYKTEREHLIAFANFVKSNKLDVHLRNHDWAKFARGYNGAGYKQNKYDIKLKAAYNKYKAIDDSKKTDEKIEKMHIGDSVITSYPIVEQDKNK